LTWKAITTVSGSTAVTLPSEYTELIILCGTTAGGTFTFHVPKIALSSTAKDIRDGYDSGVGTTCACKISVTNASANCVFVYVDGIDRTSTVTLSVFYR